MRSAPFDRNDRGPEIVKRSDLPLTNYGLVLSERRIVYVVTPKAACTSVLWALAHVHGAAPESFTATTAPLVTRRLTVHDLSKWRGVQRLETLSDDDLAALDPRSGWFVFGIAREPLSRLWSAWQSKLLLREPVYVRRFGDAAWFPRRPTSSADVIDDFEAFVDALRRDTDLVAADPHWAPQTLILRGDSFSHVGRVEQLEETYRELEAHLHRSGWHGTLPRTRDNRSILRLRTAWLRPATIEAINDLYANDFVSFGYPPLEPRAASATSGADHDEALLDAVRQMIERHERIGDLSEMLQRAADPEIDVTGADRRRTTWIRDTLKRARG